MIGAQADIGPANQSIGDDRVCAWAHQIRQLVLQESRRADVGHIGSALSVVDLLAVLYGAILDIPHPSHPERDRFILSKGHAALALYACLHLRGWLDRGELATYCVDGGRLGVHPDRTLKGVDFTTGSLGQGLAFGVGAALAARMQNSHRRVFTLISDAECNEGSVWESVMFAAHTRLANLVAIVDANGQQALGYTSDVLDLSPLGDRWSAFGWNVIEVDGHDHRQLLAAFRGLNATEGRPNVIIAHTVSGHGVSFMEGQIGWHYWPMSNEQYVQALDELQECTCAAPLFGP